MKRSRKLKWGIATLVLFFIALLLVYRAMPSKTLEFPKDQDVFWEYTLRQVKSLEEKGAIKLDSSIDLNKPRAELAYILPSILTIYNRVVEKPTLPRLVELDDTLQISFEGYKLFVKRGALITKATKKHLGTYYDVQMTSAGSTHTLKVVYRGKPWDNEQLCALPVVEASLKHQVDPAILMSIIRHTSDFRFDFVGEQETYGILSLDSGMGLEQVEMGAIILRNALKKEPTQEDAIATMYPSRKIRGESMNWRKNPLKDTWVKQVIADIAFYREKGLPTSQSPQKLDENDISVDALTADSLMNSDMTGDDLPENATDSAQAEE